MIKFKDLGPLVNNANRVPFAARFHEKLINKINKICCSDQKDRNVEWASVLKRRRSINSIQMKTSAFCQSETKNTIRFFLFWTTLKLCSYILNIILERRYLLTYNCERKIWKWWVFFCFVFGMRPGEYVDQCIYLFLCIRLRINFYVQKHVFKIRSYGERAW